MTITRTTKILGALAAAIMALLFMAPSAGAQPYPGGAVLTLSTTSGGPGTLVTATIQGCMPGATVDFSFESTPIHLGSDVVDADGTATITFPVPNVAPGTHYVVATCEAPDGSIITLRDPFTVTGAGTGGGSGTLPRTGSDNTLLIQAGAGLLAGGALLLLITRKRSNRASA